MKIKLFILLFICLLPFSTFAYPDVEIAEISLGLTTTPVDFVKISDSQAAVAVGENAKLINLATFALETTQPPTPDDDETSTDDVPGQITSLAFDSTRNRLWATQDDGDLIYFDLSDLTKNPTVLTISEGSEIGPIAMSSDDTYIAIGDSPNKEVHLLKIGESTPTSDPVDIIGQDSFTFTDVAYGGSSFFFTTDVGVIVTRTIGSSGVGQIEIDIATPANLSSIAAFPSGNYLYASDPTGGGMIRINASSKIVEKDASDIEIDQNTNLSSVVVTNVDDNGAAAVYAYISGSQGVSVVNTGTDVVLNMGDPSSSNKYPISTTATPYLLIASSKTDGYVYSENSIASMTVISANPWVTLSSPTYSDGTSYLGTTNEATITFDSDLDGTYEVRVGGDVDASGALLVNTDGASSGDVTADTDITFTFNYADNESNLDEGDNLVYVFVTDSSSNRGRKATTLSVDTPPPAITLLSTGFGDQRVYLNIQRLDISDISHYNIYVSTNADEVLTMTTVTATATQTDSGNIKAKVDGLTNGTTYYMAAEAVDANGNVGPRVNTLSDGSVASAIPQVTIGLAALTGEKDCSLNKTKHFSASSLAFIFVPIFILLFFRNRKKIVLILFILFFILSLSPNSYAKNKDYKKESPQWWSSEIKVGFWLPSNSTTEDFFGKCCNIVPKLQAGFLYHRKYGIELGVGFFTKAGDAIGATTGAKSEDRYRFIMVPIETNLVWRADYFSWRYLVPYLKFGADYVYFHDSVRGRSIQNWKFGIHGTSGIQFNIGNFADMRQTLDDSSGINDLFWTFEAQYQWINNFGGNGINLSGWLFSTGFLFEF